MKKKSPLQPYSKSKKIKTLERELLQVCLEAAQMEMLQGENLTKEKSIRKSMLAFKKATVEDMFKYSRSITVATNNIEKKNYRVAEKSFSLKYMLHV